MSDNRQIVQRIFAFGVISIGVLTLVVGFPVLLFSAPPPAWVPLLRVVGYTSGVVMVAAGAGLLLARTARAAVSVLFPFFTLWTLTRIPVVLSNPGREISWFAVGEIGAIAAGAAVLFDWLVDLREGSTLQRLMRRYGLPSARILFALALVTFGLSHFFEFAARTVSLVPAWLPFRAGWADLAGAGQIAAGLGVLFSIYPRVAAASEAAMMSVFTVLIWIPAVVSQPRVPSNWAEFLFTFAIAGAAWVMAEGLPSYTLPALATPVGVRRE